MIAVEWNDWHAPGQGPGKPGVPRTGLLLAVAPTTRDPVDLVYVITEAMPWDKDVPYPREKRKIILPVKLTQITVKGVHIPFEPHGAGK